MKLDYDLLSETPSHINPVKDRELDLSNLNIPKIENLALTKDLNDTINLANNDIRSLENIPPLPRLSTLLLQNNRISKIHPDLPEKIPNLHSLYLSDNEIKELGELESLKGLKNLQYISLQTNPVTQNQYYRPYLLHILPSLRVIDYKRVTDLERSVAKKQFSGAEGAKLAEGLGMQKGKVFDVDDETTVKVAKKMVLCDKEVKKIKEAILKATSLDEILVLEKKLESGGVF